MPQCALGRPAALLAEEGSPDPTCARPSFRPALLRCLGARQGAIAFAGAEFDEGDVGVGVVVDEVLGEEGGADAPVAGLEEAGDDEGEEEGDDEEREAGHKEQRGHWLLEKRNVRDGREHVVQVRQPVVVFSGVLMFFQVVQDRLLKCTFVC